jgi:ABC-type molybdate transport system substrate-binding protein
MYMYKKLTAILMAAALVCSVTACGSISTSSATSNAPVSETSSGTDSSISTAAPTDAEVIIFADSELDVAIKKIQKKYEAAHPGVRIIYNFDAGTTLASEIIAKAGADIIITADESAIGSLDEQASTDVNPNRNNLLVSSTRVTLEGGYYAGVLSRAINPDGAAEFLSYLQNNDSAKEALKDAKDSHAKEVAKIESQNAAAESATTDSTVDSATVS